MTSESASVRFQDVTRRYGELRALDRFSLDVAPGEFVTLLGPSGSGKTTALNILAGFDQASEGEVFIEERSVGALPPERRNVGMVFQSFALFPHMKVLDNIAFPLRMRGRDKHDIEQRVSRVLELVRLEGLAARLPAALSGGQRQRVALARAIVAEPPVLLMDECLSALDLKLREELREEIKQLHRKLGTTIIFVTHDQGEALTLSQRVAVLSNGRIAQVDTPQGLYDRPANRFVAGFIGRTNIIPASAANGSAIELPDLGLTLAGRRAALAVSLRPEKLTRITSDNRPLTFEGVIEDVTFLGSLVEARVRTRTGFRMHFCESRSGTHSALAEGDTIKLGFSAEDAVPLPD